MPNKPPPSGFARSTTNYPTYSKWTPTGQFRIRSRRFLNPLFEIEEWRRRGVHRLMEEKTEWSDDVEHRWRRVTNGEYGIHTRFKIEREI